jgi:uncharacterized protein YkwD
MRRALLLTLVIALGGTARGAEKSPATAPVASESAAPERPRFTHAEFAAALLAETNRVRAKHGRRPFKAHSDLEAAADDQAVFMAMAVTAQHTSPIRRQHTPADRVRRHGLEMEGAKLAENVASFPVGREIDPPPVAEIAATLVEQWMNSPGHRANLLSRDFTHFGGAVRLSRVLGNQWCAFGVQVFFKPRDPFGRGV